ncbi:NAD(P)H-dependent oxidoreductase [Mitsuaria sp. GD03876]|uniref:flavodoxin family protein n=1 Tax=Mitsuaria sp. GD03876 TaxID=2975399 RepID=UPI00244C86C5|nr:NAD(P)H-dependent oxidoreductase [Mitsuaria sp. GD03876]MDH0863918.1 NAD(P)H-dependent oxidoreductase [Mitsuaria sp. GD03876]
MNERQLFLVGSGRSNGNSEQLARRAALGAPDAEQRWIHLLDHALPPFIDRRHDAIPLYPAPTGAEKLLLDATLWADHLIFVSPLYWYAMPADIKRYLDFWSAWLRHPTADFKATMAGKRLSVVTSVSDEDLEVATPMIKSYELTAKYMGMAMGEVIVGYGNRPGEVLLDERLLDQVDAMLKAPAAR